MYFLRFRMLEELLYLLVWQNGKPEITMNVKSTIFFFFFKSTLCGFNYKKIITPRISH